MERNIDFVGKRKLFGIFSAILVLASLVVAFVIGPNYGIDFKGGSDIILKFEDDVSPDQVREAAARAGFADATVTRFGDDEDNQFMVQTSVISVVNQGKVDQIVANVKGLAEIRKADWSEERPDRLDLVLASAVEPAQLEEAARKAGLVDVHAEKIGRPDEHRYMLRFQALRNRIQEAFEASFGEAFNPETGVERLETVGPRVGRQLRDSSVVAIVVALFFILIYIGLRFDFRYAPGAVTALVHDVIIAIGFLVLSGIEVSLPIIAAMLAIVGYSLNDTIVVFDRIRENTVERAGEPLIDIVNDSLNQTLSRTLITSITTLIAVLAIAIFGGGLIRDFSITLIVGVVVGTYSSIFIASPVFILMDRYARNRQKTKELLARERAAQAETLESSPTGEG